MGTHIHTHMRGRVCVYVCPSCKGVGIGMVVRGMEEFTRVITFLLYRFGLYMKLLSSFVKLRFLCIFLLYEFYNTHTLEILDSDAC